MKTVRWAVLGGALFASLAAFPWDGAGTDDQALGAIEQLRPGYAPWRSPLFEPSDNAEKLLFVLQAATGGTILGWIIGRRRKA